MPQDAESGARAKEYGHKAAAEIACKIGASSVSDTSNEFSLEGRLITIRCAHKRTTSVGVTYKMLERIDSVIAAFENQDGEYDLFEMSPARYRARMRNSKNKGKVGLVTRSAFRKIGKPVGTVRID